MPYGGGWPQGGRRGPCHYACYAAIESDLARSLMTTLDGSSDRWTQKGSGINTCMSAVAQIACVSDVCPEVVGR